MGPSGILLMLSLLALGGVALILVDDGDSGGGDDDPTGDETLTVTGEDPDITLKTGDGNDTITSAANAKDLDSATIDTGAGNDKIDLGISVEAVDIHTGAGDDVVSVLGVGHGTIETASGNDTVNTIASPARGDDFTLKLGDGNDQANIDGTVSEGVKIYGEGGDDTLALTNPGQIYRSEGNDTIEDDYAPILLGGDGADKFIISTEIFPEDVVGKLVPFETDTIPEASDDTDDYLLGYDADTGTLGLYFATIGDFEPGKDMISVDVSETDGFTFTSATIIPISSDTNVTDRPDYADDDSELSHIDLYFKNADATITQKLTMSVYHKAGTDIDPDDILFLGAEPRDGIEAVIA